ncbi:Rieske 2Fe-2S domain-containing protein [Polynucleobacter sp. JS-JIR-5-A7]|uniref:Rieske 2Fe-2S domain-containing protein n=1 Tax=Polynucleobacter sp. JS-JIR-5-A7 TaxID=1758395 RepID=UPI001BFD18A8|nr:Rieske 2Fe-2S domain-containing protein [Polynucleobacter sp. JS-JIR-5-A7]QWE06608.1 MBL fold metallo-hydrolase [Polynucleobacter sp. JS-JIR-5-A7]
MNPDIISIQKNVFLKNTKKIISYEIKKPKEESFTEHAEFFLGKVKGEWVAYDRICDHNGGNLSLDPGKKTATCPIHKWTLLLSEGVYENACPKKQLKVVDKENILCVLKEDESFPLVPCEMLYGGEIRIDFNAHASVSLVAGSISIITDPWYIGPCFATGWWHLYPPSVEAVDRLVNADLIYISHNHSDHLHIPTLEKYVSKDKCFLVPNFESKSVETILRKLGYNNLIIADFLEEVTINKDESIKLIIVKSGDDRDDSSLLVYTKENVIFFGVDTNMPNNWVLPKVDMLFTLFAGGASAFPSRIENFDLQKKIEIANANRNSVLTHYVKKLVAATMPKFVIPYAGYFTEINRDLDVKRINIKNSPDDLIQYVEATFPEVIGINPIETSRLNIFGKDLNKLEQYESPLYFLDEEYVKEEITKFSSDAEGFISKKLLILGEKFLSASFFDKLTIVIIPSNDDFSNFENTALVVNFSQEGRGSSIIDIDKKLDSQVIDMLRKHTRNNIELLRVRQGSLQGVFEQGLPLEDLSIGFQIKMFRDPNVYNFKFWDHFTNREIIGGHALVAKL